MTLTIPPLVPMRFCARMTGWYFWPGARDVTEMVGCVRSRKSAGDTIGPPGLMLTR